MKLITFVKVNKYLKMATWWQQQEVLQLLLVTVKVLLASFLLVLLPLVLAQASLSHINDEDCCSIELCVCTRYSRGSTRCSWSSARPSGHLN